MPQVAIFAAYSAGAMIATRVEVPTTVTANKIKALAGHEKTAHVFARLAPHAANERCACFACDPPKPTAGLKRGWYWQGAGWGKPPRKLFLRYDIGARNVRLNVTGGEFFVVVADCDVDEWLAELSTRDRLGLLLALPLTIERAATKTKREVSDDEREPAS